MTNKADNYLAYNKETWNRRVQTHLESEFYDINSFLRGQSSLKSIELELLGDIAGKSILHLQCHFGQDTISLARLGAHVTGVDLSDKAIETARELATELNTNADFICCDVYELDKYLDKQFDIVFTSYGTIGWLPDLNRWGNVISKFLKPKGKLVFIDFHPTSLMFDDDFKEIKYNYFNKGPINFTEKGSYADKDSTIETEYYWWDHSLSDIINSLIKNNLTIQQFDEYDYSPYDCYPMTEEVELNKYRIRHLENKIPLVFSLVATPQMAIYKVNPCICERTRI
jgi:SAM-dependent methyltransferase